MKAVFAIALGLMFAGALFAQGGKRDPAFDTVPFERWLAGADQAQIPWKPAVAAGELSNHQRLTAHIRIQVDGREILKHRGHGKLLFLVQFTDGEGRNWQGHDTFDLDHVNDSFGAAELLYAQATFVLPGDYQVAIAMVDQQTNEYSLARRPLRVAALKSDPLPDAWNDLPAVEFATDNETPDSWFLPSVKGEMSLPVVTRRPIHIEVLLNLTLSAWTAGSIRAHNTAMAVLVPVFRVLSQMDVRTGSLDIAVLDLEQRRVTFEQQDVSDLDWPALKTAIREAAPHTVDVRALATRKQRAEFFVKEVGRRVEAAAEGAPLHVLIVLSAPVEFGKGEHPGSVAAARRPNQRIFYIRDHGWRPAGQHLRAGGGLGRGRGRFGMPSTPGASPYTDQLANTVKPLNPRLFGVYTPMDFRKALAAILSDIARM